MLWLWTVLVSTRMKIIYSSFFFSVFCFLLFFSPSMHLLRNPTSAEVRLVTVLLYRVFLPQVSWTYLVTMLFLDVFLISLACLVCGYLDVAVGTGTDVLLHVLWTFLSAFCSPAYKSSFGANPVKTVTKLLFIRHILVNSLNFYVHREQRVFSRRVTQYMAAAYAVTVIPGTFLYIFWSESTLRLFLGISSAVFFGATVFYLGKKVMDKRRKLTELRDNGIPLSRECDLKLEPPEAASGTAVKAIAGPFSNRSGFTFSDNWKLQQQPNSPARETTEDAPIEASRPPSLSPTALSEAYLSTVTNEIFGAHECVPPVLNEDYVPPLTPSKLSPSATMAFTYVRINRVLRDGRVRAKCCIAGVVTAALAGFLSSVVGASSPPIFLFLSVFNLPTYLFMNIVAAHEIPGAVFRFALAFYFGTYNVSDFFLLLLMVPYCCGLAVGHELGGRVLGKRSAALFFCCVLVSAISILISHSSHMLFVILVVCVCTVGGSTYFERLRIQDELRVHYEAQRQREERQRQALEQLRREHNSVMNRLKGDESRIPYWAGYDNDDDREYSVRRDRRPPVVVPVSPDTGALHGPQGNVRLFQEGKNSASPGSETSLKSFEIPDSTTSRERGNWVVPVEEPTHTASENH